MGAITWLVNKIEPSSKKQNAWYMSQILNNIKRRDAEISTFWLIVSMQPHCVVAGRQELKKTDVKSNKTNIMIHHTILLL